MARYLITGALGCIGSWAIRHAVEAGDFVVAADLGTDRTRLRLVAGRDVEREVEFASCDVTDQDALRRLVVEHRVDRIIHLAALQVPASHANPPLGASVNVVGTSNVLEVARTNELENVVYASSVAVYGAELIGSLVPRDADQNPDNFYGVYKRADEGVARLYHKHHGVPSVGLRPHTVYGPGRDTGLTSSPTSAMLAAVKGEDFEIPFSGSVGMQFASDVALTFLRVSAVPGDGRAHSITGSVTDMDDLASLINARSSKGTITVSGDPLPFPAHLDERSLVDMIGEVPCVGLSDGIAETMAHFESADPSLLPTT